MKLLWRNQKVEEATWESKDDMRIRYPNLFASMNDETEGTIPILSFLVLTMLEIVSVCVPHHHSGTNDPKGDNVMPCILGYNIDYDSDALIIPKP